MQQLVDNRYRIVKPLGSGGMADVFLAHDDVLDRDVALKVMSTRYASDGEFVERFKREAQSAAALSHPNIVSIFDRGEAEDGTYYIAMEYLPGGTLKDRILKRGALPARTAAAVALQIAEALCAAHERDVVHRDIKPHNILITETGDVKVTDFGIARAASSSTMTRTGHILGTAHYISPEQAMGEPVGPASDLYSLGIVLYEMLTGELPFDADTPLGIAMKHVNGHLRPPQTVNPAVPDGINAVTVRLLAKHPEDRYASDAELIEDLERIVAGLAPSAATTEMMTRVMPAAVPAGTTRLAPAPPPQGALREKKRRRAAPLILTLLALLTLIPLAYAGYRILGAEPQVDASPEKQVPRIAVPDLVDMTLDEARDQHGDDFDIVVAELVDGERPVDTILQQDPSGGEAEKGSTIEVNIVGTQVAGVPDVVGTARGAAEQELAGSGFEVRTQKQVSSFEEEGLVMSQEPGGGARVEAGSEVTIFVGTGPSTVEVPNVTGNTPAQAAEILKEAGLRLGSRSEDYSAGVAEGSIIYQDPTGGESAEPGSAVNVTVSLGPEQVEVPEVYGASLAEAQQLVDEAGLNSTTIEVEGQEAAGTALSTDPPAGTLLDPETTVTIYYSSGPPEPTATPEPEAAPEPQVAPEDQQEERGTTDSGAGNANGGTPSGGGAGSGGPGNGGPGNDGPGNDGPGNGGPGNGGPGNG
ncbi:MAG TPA: Stk1 family PASTA domain-containing Ser/Thr kinase [Rubrobacter sp.]|nr:Stk1 family PASTA domain-containing Ser/Thr kinase [Rubrobacter sp.]